MIETLTPVLSRQIVSPSMAARGMRSAAELARDKPCGTRMRYYAGCRCSACRAANTAYARERQEARARGETNNLVGAERARAHLLKLSMCGVGYKTAADAAKVASSIVSKIINGQRLKIRAQTERRILAVTETTAADGARVCARQTWRMLDELIAAGYSRARLGSEIMGHRVASLQISRGQVVVSTDARVSSVWEQLRLADSTADIRSRMQLQELREEGFRLDRIQREVEILAMARGWPVVAIQPPPKRGKWLPPQGLTHRAALLIGLVHTALTGEPE